MFIRLISLITGLLALTAPVLLALLVSGTLEPLRPVRFSYLSTFILAGLVLSIGYFCVAVFARKLAAFCLTIRCLVTLMLALPLTFALYLAIASDVLLVTIACLAISTFTAWLLFVCVWPGSSSSFNRDALRRVPYLKR